MATQMTKYSNQVNRGTRNEGNRLGEFKIYGKQLYKITSKRLKWQKKGESDLMGQKVN